MRRNRRVLVAAAVVLAALTGGVLWAWYGVLDGGDAVQRAEIEGLSQRDADSGEADGGGGSDGDDAELPEVVNVLVTGSDSRDGLSDEEIHELSLGSFAGARPDTIMLVQMRPDGSDAALLSIPRDLRVEGCDGSTNRINAAFAIAERQGREGGSCLVETVTAVTGIPVHHYVQVDVVGFMEVVDTVGGVEMCFERDLRDARAGLDVPAGCQRLDGATSLSYVRARSIDGSGDFGRMKRQQGFMKALADEASGAAFFANVPRLVRTIEQVSDAVTTDSGLGLGTMRAIASAFGDADSEDIASATVPGDNAMIGGAAYVVMREAEAEELFAAFRHGRAHDQLAEPSTASD